MGPPSKRPKRNIGVLTSARLFNADSPITKPETDIQSFLSICLISWNQYSENEKEDIISTLPTAYQIVNHDSEGKIVCPVGSDFVASDVIIKDQIARFKRDVMDGFYTKTWQEKARKAMEDRMNGKFDAYLAQNTDEMFLDVDEDHKESDAASSDGEYGTNKNKHKRDGKHRKPARRTPKTWSALTDIVDTELDHQMDELAQPEPAKRT